MHISFDRGVLGSLYLMATGSGFAVYETYPSVWAVVFCAVLVLYVAVILLVGWYVRTEARAARETETESELNSIVDTLHLPCGHPGECDRCAGFHWGLSTALIAGVGASAGLLPQATIRQLFGPWAVVIGAFVFVLAVGVHGVLNSLQTQGRIGMDSVLFEGRSKLVLGFVAGISTVMMGLGSYVVVL